MQQGLLGLTWFRIIEKLKKKYYHRTYTLFAGDSLKYTCKETFFIISTLKCGFVIAF